MYARKLQKAVGLLLSILIAVSLFWSLPGNANAASGTVYERENNDSYLRADRTYDDYDSYGLMNSTSDVDYWVVSFPHGGRANFYLGRIPSGKNYDMYIYSSNGTSLLRSSTNSGNTSELVSMSVSANTNYYIKIKSASGCSTTSYYLFRARAYPSKTLQVPLYAQQTGDTCGPASGRMVLGYYGISVTEGDYILKANEIIEKNNDPQADYTYVWVNTSTINSYLSANGKSTRYKWKELNDYSLDNFSNIILRNIINDHPVQIPMKFSSNAYFPYSTGGHYMVIKGLEYNSSTSAYNIILNDPNGANEFTVPIGNIQSYSKAHSGLIICVND